MTFEEAVKTYEPKGVKLTKEKKGFGATFGDFDFEDTNLDRLLGDMDALIELEASDTFTLLDEVGDNDESIVEFTANGEKHQIENVSVSEALKEAKQMWTELQPPPPPPKRTRRTAEAAPAEAVAEPEAPKRRRKASAETANGEAQDGEVLPPELPSDNSAAIAALEVVVAGVTKAREGLLNLLQALNSTGQVEAQPLPDIEGAEAPKRGRGRPRTAG